MQHPPKVRDKKKKQRSARRSLLYVSAVCVLALAFVLLLPAIKTWFPTNGLDVPSVAFPFRTLATLNKDELMSITVSHKDGETYTLLYQNEQLALKRDGGTPAAINEAYVDSILKAATTIAVEDTVTEDVREVYAHLPDMGLNPPEITVRVRSQNGREDVLQFGWNIPGTTYYYYRWSGSEGVYMCDSGLYEAFEYTANMLPAVQQPLLQKSLIDRISIRSQGQEPMEIHFNTTDASSATLLAPYQYPVDPAIAEALLTAASGFHLGIQHGEATAENRAKYGLLNPQAVIDIHQREGAYGEVDETGIWTARTAQEQNLRITLGQPDGDYLYTCEYEGECYSVSTLLVSALLGATPDTLLSRHPADMGEAAIAAIQVQYDGRILDIRRQRSERVLPDNALATDAEGNTLYDVTITRNGEPLAEDAFTSFVSRLKAMQVSGLAEKDSFAGGTLPRWQMTLTTETGRTRTITAHAIDPFFDAISIDGTIIHTLPFESLEVALADLM